MKQLNLFPCYEDLIESYLKTTSVRLGEKYAHEFSVGDKIVITVGWDEENTRIIRKAIVTRVVKKKINHITIGDLMGESLDCVFPEVVPIILSLVYRRRVSDEDFVTIISWRYL